MRRMLTTLPLKSSSLEAAADAWNPSVTPHSGQEGFEGGPETPRGPLSGGALGESLIS